MASAPPIAAHVLQRHRQAIARETLTHGLRDLLQCHRKPAPKPVADHCWQGAKAMGCQVVASRTLRPADPGNVSWSREVLFASLLQTSFRIDGAISTELDGNHDRGGGCQQCGSVVPSAGGRGRFSLRRRWRLELACCIAGRDCLEGALNATSRKLYQSHLAGTSWDGGGTPILQLRGRWAESKPFPTMSHLPRGVAFSYRYMKHPSLLHFFDPI